MISRFIHVALAVVSMLYPVVAEDIRIPMDACNVDIAEAQSFDESTGSQWCAMRAMDGVFVNGIKAWHTSDSLKAWVTGLEVSFTDGKTTMIGSQHGEFYSEAEWDPAEVGVDWMVRIDELAFEEAIQPRREEVGDKCLNKFEFVLTNGEHFCAGGYRYGFPDVDDPVANRCRKEKPTDPRHSIRGTLLRLSGALGTSGMEAITAYYLRSDAKNTEVHNVVISPSIKELNQRSEGDRGLTQKTLMIGHCLNELESGNVTFTLSKDTQFSKTKKVTHEVSNAWHVGTEVSFEYQFGTPVIFTKVGVKQDFFWERTEMTSDENTEGSSVTVKWGVNVPVAPGKAVRVEGYAIEGKMDVTWTGKMTLTLETGQKVTFPTGGIMKDTLFSQSYTIVDEEDPEQARQAVLSGDGSLVDEEGNELPPPAGRRFIA